MDAVEIKKALDGVTSTVAEMRGALEAHQKGLDPLVKEHAENAAKAVADGLREEWKKADEESDKRWQVVDEKLAKFNELLPKMNADGSQKKAHMADVLLGLATGFGMKDFPVEAGRRISQEHIEKAIERVKTVYGTPVTTSTGSGLVQTQYGLDITEYIRQRAVIANLLTWVPLEFETYQEPKVTTGATWYCQTTEGSTEKTSSTLVIGTTTMTARTYAAIVPISNQLLQSSAPVADAVLRGEFGNSAAEKLDDQLLNGVSGSNEIAGLLLTSGIGNVNITTDLSWDDFITGRKTISKALKSAPRLNTIANADAIARMMGLKDNQGQYIWREPVVNGSIAQIPFVGPIWQDENLATSNNKTTILIGDFDSMNIKGGRKEELNILPNPYLDGCYQYNCTAFRAEFRAALMVKRAGAFCKLSNVPV